ncbi:apolipoprotein N-acyltransferase [Trichocoleus sp. FACHB-591]|uniref:apolipoprotein N-acyltransferase n=1 Tax=Trichocoleus sp. FACHB-591 TaxID=2692872 RepID=UPI001683213A|nr:apolipoprotein N-acyltransferase [Trichocoleus sp. FACHB-591]
MPKFFNIELKPPQLRRLSIALGGGLLMGLTPAPLNAWPLAWIALVPLWAMTLQVARGNYRERSLLGLAWGIGYHGLAVSWITGVHPMTWMGVPWLASLAIALFCWTFLTLWGAVLVAVWAGCWGWLVQRAKLPTGIRLLAGVALWCGLESFWSWGPLWWTSVSYTQSPHNLAILHLGQLSGPMMITAAIVAVNGLLAEAWITYRQSRQGQPTENRVRKLAIAPLVTASVLFVGLHLLGWNLSNRVLVSPPDTALKIGIIQGNIPNEIKLDVQGWRQALTGYTTGYNQLTDQGVAAVLTPEGALPFLWTGANLTQSSFYQAVRDRGVVAWVGAFGQKGGSITNSLFTVLGNGEIFSQYDKIRLVPLGEYIPFEDVLGRLIDRLSPLDAHMIPGQVGQIFETPFGRAIAGICYESAFAEHFRIQAAQGGQFILSSSNDAHYSPSMTAQHHAQDVMRAIETDRWVARATNTGYSGIIDPHGKTQWLSGLNIYQLHSDTIYRRQTQTLFVRWGDWLTPLIVMLAIVLTLHSWYRH